MSPLRQALFDYLAVRRSLGFKLGRAEGLLVQFVSYAEERGEQHLRISTMLAWATLWSDCWQLLGCEWARPLHSIVTT